jgi:hypothetical protein
VKAAASGRVASNPVRPRRDILRRLLGTFDLRQPSWSRPLPRVTVHTGRWLPAWVVHGCSGAVAVACTAMVATSRFQWLVAALLVAAMVVRPGIASPTPFVLWMAALLTFGQQAPYSIRTFGLIFGVHLLAVLTTASADLTRATRFEIGVLSEPIRRLLVIQVIVQPVAWGASWVAARNVTVPWVTVAAAAGLVALSWFLLTQLHAGAD